MHPYAYHDLWHVILLQLLPQILLISAGYMRLLKRTMITDDTW